MLGVILLLYFDNFIRFTYSTCYGFLGFLGDLFSSILIDEPKVVRVLKVLLWIGVSLLAMPWLMALKPYLPITLIIVTAIIIIMHQYSGRLLNSKLSKVFLDEVFKEPSKLFKLLEELRERSLINDIFDESRGSRSILSLFPLMLLPIIYAIFILFATAYIVSIPAQSSSNIHEFMMLGLAIINITAIALTVTSNSTVNVQHNQVRQGNTYMINITDAISSLINEYILPRKPKTALGHAYKITYYIAYILPKPKVRVEPPKITGGIYVCNNDLKNKIVEFIYGNGKGCGNEGGSGKGSGETLRGICEVLACSNVIGLDSLLEVESPYRFLEPNNVDSKKRTYITIPLKRSDSRGIIVLKALKGHIIKYRESNGTDPVKCMPHRLISILAIGDEELISELNMILGAYSRVPTDYELINCLKFKRSSMRRLFSNKS